jgi:ankyrin repeat protein
VTLTSEAIMDILFSAFHAGNVELVELILSHATYFDLNTRDERRNTPLLYASAWGQVGIMNQILSGQQSVNVNSKDCEGKSALHWASSQDHHEAVQVLLQHRVIDKNARDRDERTPLICASELGFTQVVKVLLEDPDVERNARNKNHLTALRLASQNGYSQVVKVLLEDPGVERNARDFFGWTSLLLASYEGYSDVVKVLLEDRGVNLDAKEKEGRNALLLASINGQTDTFRTLLSSGMFKISESDYYGQNALHLAAFEGKVDIVQIIMSSFPVLSRDDVNTRDANNNTPLALAALGERFEMVKLLLNYPGIDVEAVNSDGQNALHMACSVGNREIAELLLQTTGINVNASDNGGYTALHWASQSASPNRIPFRTRKPDFPVDQSGYDHVAKYLFPVNRSEVVGLLLKSGVDVNAQEKDGKTALHLAVKNREDEIVKLILSSPALDLHLKDNCGVAAYESLWGYFPLQARNTRKRSAFWMDN